MKFLGQPYYVGLLSAAALHGAAHHQPQEFQVVTNKQFRPAVLVGQFGETRNWSYWGRPAYTALPPASTTVFGSQ